MRDREVAVGRHSETKQLLPVITGDDGRLTTGPPLDGSAATFIGLVPEMARDSRLVGRWRHFKGGEYEFVAVVDSSQNGPLVLYLDADREAWLRPRAMIEELVERDGVRCPRFERISA